MPTDCCTFQFLYKLKSLHISYSFPLRHYSHYQNISNCVIVGFQCVIQYRLFNYKKKDQISNASLLFKKIVQISIAVVGDVIHFPKNEQIFIALVLLKRRTHFHCSIGRSSSFPKNTQISFALVLFISRKKKKFSFCWCPSFSTRLKTGL